jgi:hypothetical protein
MSQNAGLSDFSHHYAFRGDVELGDALISSVEGKASAIEATLGPHSSLPDP